MLHAPMEGLKVVDFSTIVAGPWATRLIDDCEAEVIKIETAGEGDLMRFTPPIVKGASRVFAQFNRGKKSVVLDLKAPEGLEAARHLMDEADVVMENFRPGVMQRLGLGYDQAAARNPRPVYCSVRAFGQEGLAERPHRSTIFPPTRTADGYITVPLVTPRNYQALFALIGKPDGIDDAALTKPGALAGRGGEIAARLADWCAGRTSQACMESLHAAGLACGIHAARATVLDHPHLAARGVFGGLEDAEGAFKVLSPPFRLRDTPREARAFVACLGEHTDSVLSDLKERS